jgi:hypothetical protein
MPNQNQINRLRQAVAKVAERMTRATARESARSGPPSPGDLYVFDAGEEVALEWLVVRQHPDDSGILLLAPCDDFPLAGTTDVQIPRELVDRPLNVRCGEALWVPLHFCQSRLRTGSVPEEPLRLVRKRIADLARGRIEGSEKDCQTDADPEYEDWLALLAQARERLQQRADQTPLAGAAHRRHPRSQAGP